jgi:hypothetical protein
MKGSISEFELGVIRSRMSRRSTIEGEARRAEDLDADRL